jgi:hypothetical protein
MQVVDGLPGLRSVIDDQTKVVPIALIMGHCGGL